MSQLQELIEEIGLDDDECHNPLCETCNGPINEGTGECLDAECVQYTENEKAEKQMSYAEWIGEK